MAEKGARILSGMRPSGKLHLGHYHGVLESWLKLQKEAECLFFVADWHALTTEYANPADIGQNTEEMVIDWLAVGIDPQESIVFLQSHVKEHAELFLLLSMLTPLSWLERNPTYKELLTETKDRDIHTYGFLGYPVLQTADIIIYRATRVPVGMDQLPHLELAREITRRFNYLYGETFPEPQSILTEAPKILGTDGRKMSKSYNNAIYLSDPPGVVEKKLLTMVTDTARKTRKDPGNPDVCPLFTSFHQLYSDEDTLKWVREGCSSAAIGCIECKRRLIPEILGRIEPIQRRREDIERDRHLVWQTLEEGSLKARSIASSTMEEVRRLLSLR